MTQLLKIGTRGSPLALTQTRTVQSALKAHHPELKTEIVIIKTSGDWSPEQGETRLKDEEGGKGQFAKEIQAALLAGDIDCAVHSMKDMETSLPDGLMIGHMLPREDARDVLIFNEKHKNLSNNVQLISALPAGTIVGSASVRRQAFLLARNPDLKVVPFRGNVQTRLDKLASGQVDATLLARAGLNRLGIQPDHAVLLEPDVMLPAAGQGAVGIETRQSDAHIHALLAPFSCTQTLLRVSAERAALHVLDGSCHTPIGAHAVLDDEGQMHLRLCAARLDGSEMFEDKDSAMVNSVEDAEQLGTNLGQRLRARTPADIFMQKIVDEASNG